MQKVCTSSCPKTSPCLPCLQNRSNSNGRSFSTHQLAVKLLLRETRQADTSRKPKASESGTVSSLHPCKESCKQDFDPVTLQIVSLVMKKVASTKKGVMTRRLLFLTENQMELQPGRMQNSLPSIMILLPTLPILPQKAALLLLLQMTQCMTFISYVFPLMELKSLTKL